MADRTEIAPKRIRRARELQGHEDTLVSTARSEISQMQARVGGRFQAIIGSREISRSSISELFQREEQAVRARIESIERGVVCCSNAEPDELDSIHERLTRLRNLGSDLKKISQRALLYEKAKLLTSYLDEGMRMLTGLAQGRGESSVDAQKFFSEEHVLKLFDIFNALNRDLSRPHEIGNNELYCSIIPQEEVDQIILHLNASFYAFKRVFSDQMPQTIEQVRLQRADDFLMGEQLQLAQMEQSSGPFSEDISYAQKVLKLVFDKKRIMGHVSMAATSMGLASRARYTHGHLGFGSRGAPATHSAQLSVGSSSIFFATGLASTIYSVWRFRKARSRMRNLSDQIRLLRGVEHRVNGAINHLRVEIDKLKSQEVGAGPREVEAHQNRLKISEDHLRISLQVRAQLIEAFDQVYKEREAYSNELMDRPISGLVSAAFTVSSTATVLNAIRSGTIASSSLPIFAAVGIGAAGLGLIAGIYSTASLLSDISNTVAQIKQNKFRVKKMRALAQTYPSSKMVQDFTQLEDRKLFIDSSRLRNQIKNQKLSLATTVIFTISSLFLLLSAAAIGASTGGIAIAVLAFVALGFVASSGHYGYKRWVLTPAHQKQIALVTTGEMVQEKEKMILSISEKMRQKGIDAGEVQALFRLMGLQLRENQELFMTNPDIFLDMYFK
ncbi:MAG: hypothetical protein MRY21_01615 [Simkaniaceae bacterium]|nr:hypothetical protein [Simkaniaceae bacterium]